MLFPGLAFGRDLDFLQKSGVKRTISVHGVSEGRGLREPHCQHHGGTQVPGDASYAEESQNNELTGMAVVTLAIRNDTDNFLMLIKTFKLLELLHFLNFIIIIIVLVVFSRVLH